jgi:hypothetical protein
MDTGRGKLSASLEEIDEEVDDLSDGSRARGREPPPRRPAAAPAVDVGARPDWRAT